MESNNVIGNYRLVYETRSFKAVAPIKPHIDRKDGGHIILISKIHGYRDRTQLPVESAVEMMLLSMIVGEAMHAVLEQNGVDIACINYQENGNWAYLNGIEPEMHLHIYGRARSAKNQGFGQALHFPDPGSNFYDGFEPLSNDDIAMIRKETEAVCTEEKYSVFLKYMI